MNLAALATRGDSGGILLGQTRITYHWARIDELDQWWHWALVAGVCLLVLSYVLWWYRRDAVEQQRSVGLALIILRVAALIGILIYFFQFDRRTEQRLVRNSRVAVLVDTSLSMTLPGSPSESGLQSDFSRAEEVTKFLAQSSFLRDLAQNHEVAAYRFDQAARPTPLTALQKAAPNIVREIAAEEDGSVLNTGRRYMFAAIAAMLVAGLLIVISLGRQTFGAPNSASGGWMLLTGAVAALISLTLAAVAIVPTTGYPLAALFGTQVAIMNQPTGEVAEPAPAETDAFKSLTGIDEWAAAVQPTGIETRLGDAIKAVLDREVGNPLAGIIVLTDGRSNAGLDPKSIIASARNVRVPLYIIGQGSERSPPNLRILEVDAPQRLYPGDKFSLSAIVGSSGYAGKTVTVQVLAGPKGAEPSSFNIENEAQILLTEDDALATARFELEPKAVGTWQYLVKVLAPEGDADVRDNSSITSIDVIERKNRVLIFAGGPSREYQFARNLLYRDRDVESHVLLQSADNKSSQEAKKLLSEFPADRAALSQYDAILAFDPDWTKVPDSAVEALEQWVAEQAGGLMLVAGSVEMPKWVARSASGSKAKWLRSLSPVQLEQRGSRLLAAGRVEGQSPWPLKLTTDGQQVDFLWLNDDPQASQKLWESFEGIYSFYAAYELKPGAKALATFSDPTAAVDGQSPIYLASHFYGAGRVVFQGGSEMWRVRELGDQYFDRYYTKLVRWISQGRLLLDSDRGVLLVDREQALLGDQVIVRAVLKDERYQPLIQSEVVARLIDPLKRNLPLSLKPFSDGSQPGVYTGQFLVSQPGDYGIQLQLGGIASEEILMTNVKAKVPAIEMQRGERHDALLSQLAVETGGVYWISIAKALQPMESREPTMVEVANAPLPAVISAILPQDQVSFLPGAPDQVFQLRWLGWLMAWIAGCLSLEWLARRLHRKRA
jgi:von Willebrand factor type A domain